MDLTEIDNIMEQSNYNISSDTYLNIIQTTPQIDHIIFKPYGNYFEMWSDDGRYWKFSVYERNSYDD